MFCKLYKSITLILITYFIGTKGEDVKSNNTLCLSYQGHINFDNLFMFKYILIMHVGVQLIFLHVNIIILHVG
jgi:hypothetical protein